jgi:hypothetical protein
MKIYLPNLPQVQSAIFNEALKITGMEQISLYNSEDADFVYFGKNNSYNMYSSLPEKLLSNINLDLTLKDKIPKLCEDAGINFLRSDIIIDENTILNFTDNNVFIKPIEGGASQTPYTFTYKTYTSKDELLSTIQQECPNFFTVDEYNITISKKHIIQKAFLSDNTGYTHLYLVNCYVNGLGQIYFDGLCRNKMKFEPKNDIDDIKYPIRNVRDFCLKIPSDKTDKYDIMLQTQKLIDYYSIKNTPISMNWMVDENGKSYLIDFAYNFNRQFYMTPDFCPFDFFMEKFKYVYDLHPVIENEWSGVVVNFDLEILCDIPTVIDYAKTIGVYYTPSFVIGSSSESLMKPFICTAPTEQGCLDKLQQLKDFIESQPREN